MLVREATPLACANGMIAIRGREVHSLAWAPSTTMKGNLAFVGQRLQNTPHWLVPSQTTAKDTCNALKIHAVPFLIDACPSRCSRATFHFTTLVKNDFSLSSNHIIVQQLYQDLWGGMRVRHLLLYIQQHSPFIRGECC